MEKFKQIFYENVSKRVFISFNEYKNKKLKEFYDKRGEYLKKLNKKTILNQEKIIILKAIEEWFNKIFELTKSGKFIDWKTMNDVWNLDNGEGRFMYRLQHDNPDGNFDIKWISPNKGEIAKGTRHERVPYFKTRPGRKRKKFEFKPGMGMIYYGK